MQYSVLSSLKKRSCQDDWYLTFNKAAPHRTLLPMKSLSFLLKKNSTPLIPRYDISQKYFLLYSILAELTVFWLLLFTSPQSLPRFVIQKNVKSFCSIWLLKWSISSGPQRLPMCLLMVPDVSIIKVAWIDGQMLQAGHEVGTFFIALSWINRSYYWWGHEAQESEK